MQEEKWGDPVTGFPQVGDKATEEHDKRRNGHGAHKGHISYNHMHSSMGDRLGVIPSKCSFSKRFESSRDVEEVVEVDVLASRYTFVEGSSRSVEVHVM